MRGHARRAVSADHAWEERYHGGSGHSPLSESSPKSGRQDSFDTRCEFDSETGAGDSPKDHSSPSNDLSRNSKPTRSNQSRPRLSESASDPKTPSPPKPSATEVQREISAALEGRASRRTSSASAPGGKDVDGTSKAKSKPDLRKKLSEVQLTKNFLKKEIEARSEKIWSARLARAPEDEFQQRGKLIVVCARLPFVILHNEETNEFEVVRDEYETNICDLLASAPSERSASWLPPAEVVLVGAPVLRRKSDNSINYASEALWDDLEMYIQRELNMVPVFLPATNRDNFAEGVIFPLFHYSPPSVEKGMGLYDWEGFELVSQKFSEAVLTQYVRGDLVWINDYSLMMLPKLLRQERPDITIGFYMNCVFPSSEVYRMLPQREDILRGVLSSNVIGFHTFQYVRHFLTSCTRVLGLECTPVGIEACEEAGGTLTKVIVVPLGLNLAPYKKIVKCEEMRSQYQILADTFAGKKILVAVDGLEEKTGIPHKMMAYHKFLQKEPSWAQQCIFVQIIEVDGSELYEDVSSNDPDDTGRGVKQSLLQQVYQMVGEVNSTFGTIGHLPVHFLCQEFSRTELAALFARAHVMMDTPLRDMMSISAHEFLCCQEEKDCGVLILSEFSGSAQSLRASALCVNPWDTSAFADAIQEALEMESQDRVELYRYGQKYVHEYTLQHWALNFYDELQQADAECENERLQIPPQLDHDGPVEALRKANRRIVILGFAGTLYPRKSTRLHPKMLPKLPSVLLGNLQVIAEDPNSHLIIVSSLPRDKLDEALSSVPCWIIAEGGVCYREPHGDVWVSAVEQKDQSDWMVPVKEIMKYFAARTPGSSVVETRTTVQWHYQKTQGDHAAIQSKELLIHLWAGPLLSAPAEVVVGTDSVTVRPTGVGKASQLEKVLQLITHEECSDKPRACWLNGDTFVLCVSDLLMRDEDVFTVVQRFFEKDNAQGGDSSFAERRNSMQGRWDGGRSFPDRLDHRDAWGWDSRGGDRDTNWEEQLNLEANSKSLTELHSRMCRKYSEDDEPPFAVHRSSGLDALFSDEPVLKKVPSEPDMNVDPEGHIGPDNWHQVEERKTPDNFGSTSRAVVYTCAISRKATRASYYLQDTHDIAFLLAQFAREMRQASKGVIDALKNQEVIDASTGLTVA